MRIKAKFLIVFGVVLILGAALGGGWAVHASHADQPPLHGAMSEFILLPHPVPAPPVHFTDPGKGPASLAQFKGQLVLLNLWATWCGPCVEELPSLWKLKKAKEDAQFRVVNIAEDHAGAGAVAQFLAKHDVSGLDHYVDPDSSVGFTFGMGGLPTTYLIDAKGRVLGRLEGKADWGSSDASALIDWYLSKGTAPAGPKIEKTAG